MKGDLGRRVKAEMTRIILPSATLATATQLLKKPKELHQHNKEDHHPRAGQNPHEPVGITSETTCQTTRTTKRIATLFCNYTLTVFTEVPAKCVHKETTQQIES